MTFDLNKHVHRLLMDEPFFAALSRRIDKRIDKSIPTAGVRVNPSSGHFEMLYNPDFFEELPDIQRKGVLKHEFYHLIFEHTTTRRHDPHIIWNYATDLAINSLINEKELPKGGLIPGRAFEPLTPKQIEQMGEKAAERYNMISAKIASFPKEKNSEWQLFSPDGSENTTDIKTGELSITSEMIHRVLPSNQILYLEKLHYLML